MMHMYVWRDPVEFLGVVQAESVAEARKLLLDEIGADASTPIRLRAAHIVREWTPEIWYGSNAAFALTDSAELIESEERSERRRKRLLELGVDPL